MTDRHTGYIVILEDNIREDDAEKIIIALKMISGVIDVKPIISDPNIEIATTRVKRELTNKILDLINDY